MNGFYYLVIIYEYFKYIHIYFLFKITRNYYYKYKNILEYIPVQNNNNNILNESVSKDILKFINVNKIKNILVSLSGGVDSMVLSYIFNNIKDIKLFCCHINYNNRKESEIERDFLIEYCKKNNITLFVKNIEHIKRGEIKREDYENETKEIKFNFYKNLCEKLDCDGVFLAHHEDDKIENIFNNIMRGRKDITDLTVIKEKNNILNVNIYRPMLSHNKDDIYFLSDKYQIPYFLDTTPKWSCRGKMRNNIFPTCLDCYNNNYKKSLLKLGKESDELSNIFQKFILDKIFEIIIFGKYGFYIPICEEIYNEIILNKILKFIFCKLNKKVYINQKKTYSIINVLNNNNFVNLFDYIIFANKNKLYFIDSNLKFSNYKELIKYNYDNEFDYEKIIEGNFILNWNSKKKKYISNIEFFNKSNLKIDYIYDNIILIL